MLRYLIHMYKIKQKHVHGAYGYLVVLDSFWIRLPKYLIHAFPHQEVQSATLELNPILLL